MLLKDGRDDSIDEVYIDAWVRPCFTDYPLVIYDELPEGWSVGIDCCGETFGLGLRGNWDHDSKYVWIENGPLYVYPYRDAPDYYVKRDDYMQALLRR